MRTTLVAGASGMLGREVVAELRRRGDRVRALTRDPRRAPFADEVAVGDLEDPASLRAAVAGVDAVVSCAGASMALGGFGDRRSFARVDHLGNRALLAAARDAEIRRFVYVGVWGGERLMRTEYCAAHERFAAELAASGLPFTVVRPTGFFGFFGEVLRMARKGRGPVIGDGTARTNPVHEADVAAACADALTDSETHIGVGGPDTFTRREIVELAFRAAGRPVRLMHVPPGLFRTVAAVTRPLNPRLGALLHFGTEVSQVDCVAPVRGTRRLEEHFRQLAV